MHKHYSCEILLQNTNILIEVSSIRSGQKFTIKSCLVVENGAEKKLPLSESTAQQVICRIENGVSPTEARVFKKNNIIRQPSGTLCNNPTESEHKFTSTGIKLWRHPLAMKSYRSMKGSSSCS